MAKRRSGRRRPPRQISEHESRLFRSDLWATTVSKVGVALVRWTGICFCGYQASLVLIAWSGETTMADVTVALKATGFSGAAAGLGVLVGVAGLIYGKVQARLRRETIRQFEARVRELETTLDPGRSSSGLTTSGDTPPEEE